MLGTETFMLIKDWAPVDYHRYRYSSLVEYLTVWAAYHKCSGWSEYIDCTPSQEPNHSKTMKCYRILQIILFIGALKESAFAAPLSDQSNGSPMLTNDGAFQALFLF